MAGIQGIKISITDDTKGSVGVRTGEIDHVTTTKDPWYGPQKISSNPGSTDDYQSSITPSNSQSTIAPPGGQSTISPFGGRSTKAASSSKEEVASALVAHKRGEVLSQLISEHLNKINFKNGINAFSEVRKIAAINLLMFLKI